MAWSVKAVLLDLDGTIIRSNIDFRSMKQQLIETFAKHGADTSPFSPNQRNPHLLSAGLDQLKAASISSEQMAEVKLELSRIMDLHELNALDHTQIDDAAASALRELNEAGLSLAVVTRACHAYAEGTLHRCGLRKLVKTVIAREDIEEAKPNPEQLHQALKAVGVASWEAVYVGDTTIDLEAAQRAGVRFIAVLSGDSSEEDFR
ncbi:MAG: HAD family hydrolase, partial [Candidatus Bathyarchaeia archaeon]